MTALHAIDMSFLLLTLVTRISFFYRFERGRRRVMAMNTPPIFMLLALPPVVWIELALLVIFVVPISPHVDVALYAGITPLMFITMIGWRDVIHDKWVYGRAGITGDDMQPCLYDAWKRRP